MSVNSIISAVGPRLHSIPNRASRTRSQQAFMAILLVTGIVVVMCLYLLQTTHIRVRTYDVEATRAQYGSLRRKNANALARLAYEQRLLPMIERAQAMGYQPLDVNNYIFLPGESAPPRRTDATDAPNSAGPPVSLRSHEP
ncbi:MAG: hypothetical protein D6775_16095 [Caldilineae bacterium]|nr:MAG: hypothetical protein D6775_16095 [Caldilineae bacterium]